MTTKMEKRTGGEQHQMVRRKSEKIVTNAGMTDIADHAFRRDASRFNSTLYAGEFPKRRKQFVDEAIWRVGVQCWTTHTNLANELEQIETDDNFNKIFRLAKERREYIKKLSGLHAQTLDGLMIKRNIITLIAGLDDDIQSLMHSFFMDFDRLIIKNDRSMIPVSDNSFNTHVSRLFSTLHTFKSTVDRFERFDDKDSEANYYGLSPLIKKLIYDININISIISQHKAIGITELRMKLRVFDVCTQIGDAGLVLDALSTGMFRDFDVLLRELVTKRIDRRIPLGVVFS